MAIIVEDGTIVADANSYVSIAECRDYASLRGVELPVDDADVEALIYPAMDWIESHRSEFQGTKTDSTQSLQWPRSGVCIDGYEIDSNVIPTELKKAEMQLVIDQQNGSSLYSVGTEAQPIKQETVGPLTIKYSEVIDNGERVRPYQAYDLLEPLLKSSSGFTVRV